jgi:hypothetical protein
MRRRFYIESSRVILVFLSICARGAAAAIYSCCSYAALQLLLLSLTLYKSLVMMEGSDTDGMGNSPSAMQQNSAQCT